MHQHGSRASASKKKPRVFSPKVKTGCKTCKIRRIKCDEAKPACLKCTSTSRSCDGYELQPKRIESTRKKYSRIAKSPSLILNLTTLPSRDSCELQALQFFQLYTASHLPGCSGSDLGNCYILQLSLVEPSLYYATIALGSLHRWYATSIWDYPGSIAAKTFALQQYNKAISCVLHPTKPLRSLIVLLTCYIFSGFEALDGNYVSAFRHVSSGISMLSRKIRIGTEPISTSTSGLSLTEKQIEDKLLYHFSRLDLLASTFDSAWNPRTIDQGSLPVLPPSVSNLETANALLHVLLLRVIELKRLETSCNDAGRSVGIALMREDLQLDLLKLSNSIEYLLHTTGPLDSQELEGRRLLKVHLYTGKIMLSIPEGAQETTYDQFLSIFQDIVSEISQIVGSIPASHPNMTLQQHFSNDIGIIPALYLTGTKCRDPAIRRKALSLLLSAQRREGAWDSLVAAKVVECIIAVEEGDIAVTTCSDVAESARVFDKEVRVTSMNDHYAFVDLSRRLGNGKEPETMTESISW